MKNVILFGSGAFGLKALEYFGNASGGGMFMRFVIMDVKRRVPNMVFYTFLLKNC